MRKTIVAILLLAGACSPSPGGKDIRPSLPDARPQKVDVKAAATRRQARQLLYAREGTWQPVRTPQGTALVARDRYGDRLLMLRRIAGYDVYQLEMGCSIKGAYSLHRGRGATRDDLPPVDVSGSPGYLDLSSETRRICAQRRPEGRRLALDAAIAGMRTIMEREARPVRPAPSAEDRKAAIDAMARYRASQAGK
jgi:hypothetical protein